MKYTAKLRKKATSFRRKSTKTKGLKRPQIFYAPFSKCVQSIWKHYRPSESILCFSRWSRKRTPTASQKQKQIGLKILYIFQPISSLKVFQRFSYLIASRWPNHYCELGRNVFSLGIPTTTNFETNFTYRKFSYMDTICHLSNVFIALFGFNLFNKYLQPVV